jgi:Zn-dependent membrane protease YugP
MASVGATTFASQIVTWLPLFGLFSGFGGFHSQTYLTIMVVGWGTIMLFNLVTLPVEFDASRRALQILPKMKFISPGPESKAVENVLRAAAWTYVAAFITSLLFLSSLAEEATKPHSIAPRQQPATQPVVGSADFPLLIWE